MIMADVLKIVFAVLGTWMTLLSYWLLFEACIPAVVARASEAYERHPLRALLSGLAFTIPAVALGLILANAPLGPLKLLGVALLMALILVALLGSAGFARFVGQRLAAPQDETQPWRRVLRGGTVVSLTFLFPVMGWFLVMPAVLISGVGVVWITRQHLRVPRHSTDPGLLAG